MKLLLDTHIWLWSLVSPDKLGEHVMGALASRANELWLSPISVWEAARLLERGRVVVGVDPAQWLDDIVRATPAREAPLTHEVAVRSRQVSLSHADPADRFIVATAVVHDLTLVTADERILRSGAAPTLANH